jgi:excisionase family DNA binding protein
MFPGTTRAAKLVGIPRRTIQFWVEIGKVEAISVGRKYKVHFESLLALIQSHVNDQ